MKFLVRQQLTEEHDVFRDHLEPLAEVVADSLDDPPGGPVVWLGGCGSIDDRHYYMLFEAPDLAAMESVVTDLPGLHSIQRVMAVDRRTIGQSLMRALAGTHRQRQAHTRESSC